jgi:hypothetical protein
MYIHSNVAKRKLSKMYSPFVARQQLSRHVPTATNTRNNRTIVERVIFCAARALTKESLPVCLCIPLSLLGEKSVNTFPQRRRFVGGIISMRSVSYKREVGDQFVLELLFSTTSLSKLFRFKNI